MMILLLIVLALGALYYVGWLQFKQTGILKPFINLTIAGFAVSIKKPDSDGPKDPR
jgi:predicted ABC-type exoprotein transport system permease subunit